MEAYHPRNGNGEIDFEEPWQSWSRCSTLLLEVVGLDFPGFEFVVSSKAWTMLPVNAELRLSRVCQHLAKYRGLNSCLYYFDEGFPFSKPYILSIQAPTLA